MRFFGKVGGSSIGGWLKGKEISDNKEDWQRERELKVVLVEGSDRVGCMGKVSVEV